MMLLGLVYLAYNLTHVLATFPANIQPNTP